MKSLKNIFSGILIFWMISGYVTTAVGQYETRVAEKPAQQRLPWPDDKRVAVSLSFDDARLSQVDTGIPILDLYGVKATFYVSFERLEERLEKWRYAVANGHEIGNHSLLHPCSGNFSFARHKALEDYTLAKMRHELDEANRLIEEKLGVKAKTFAYPCGQKFVGRGQHLKSYVPLVAELFIAGRGWLDESANDPAFCDLAQVMGVELDGLTFRQAMAKIDAAAETGGWLIFAGHEIGEPDRQTVLASTLDSLCQYGVDPDNGIWLQPVQTVAEYILSHRDRIAAAAEPLYRDTYQPVEVRVEDLLRRMTLEEKIGQINMPCVYVNGLGREIPEKMEACKKFAEGTYVEGLGPGGGFFTLANTILHDGPRQQAEYFNELQKIALEKTRLKIPLIEVEEGTHGMMCSGGTIFPEGLALGSTWNMDLIKDVYTVAAREARAVGIHQLFTLVIEPNRDPRLGRNQEGYSEDPFLCSNIAAMIVSAVQGSDISAPDKTIAGFCHYPGQSQPVSGLERGAMEISQRMLREVFLQPWVAAIKHGGALGVMATYPAIDGIPAHASSEILTDILRGELGFEGLVLGEGGGISTLIYEGLAEDQKKAGELAIKAGVDVGISYEDGYMLSMIENIHEGKVSQTILDRAVRRILRIKFRLGLFENPYVNPDHAVRVSHTPENIELTRRAAREGIVLLKNDNQLLPLKKDIKSIAVIGPNANHEKNQLGDYTSISVLQDVVTILEGIQAKVSPATKVTYVKGCDVIGDENVELKKARTTAARADIAVVVVGENEWRTPNKKGTNGEGYDVASLDLTGMQLDLVKAVVESKTPTVVVLINGRPLSIRWIAENVPAILEVWIPGERGGEAVADVLFGDHNPSGRLPITIPRHVGQLPFYYNYKPSKAHWIERGWGKPYADMDPTPLFEFGFGLSYTTFEYSDLRISPGETGTSGQVEISATVRNTGNRAGQEVVQLYLRDVISTVSTPVKRLVGFEKIELQPGEEKTVLFTLTSDELALLDRHLQWVVEPGRFDVKIGRSSKDIRLEGHFICR